MDVELLIADNSGKKIYIPAIEEGIEWSTERRGVPGKLTFKVIADSTLHLNEGSAIRLTVDGIPIFFGFLFKKHQDKERIVSITAYDQLRYLTNKDTYVYENKTASELIKRLAADFRLQIGEIEHTGFVIASRIEENTSLFDMIGNALDLTLQNTKKMFVLYDDFGKLTLKNIASMKVGKPEAYLMIDEETGENFEYTSSIDSDAYNKIKLTYDNEETGKREIYIAQDGEHMNEWGILQYFDTLQKNENGKAKADALLTLYNQKNCTLKLTNVLGDNRVRAGYMVIIRLNLGDKKLTNWMLVEKCRHIYREGEHWMDLTLRGGDFVG